MWEVALDWLAVGLDPEGSSFFIESLVPEHTELTTLLSWFLPLGMLERNPTLKAEMAAMENPDDPNAETLDEIARTLEQASDARGRKLEVIRVPGPGLYRNALDEIAPASHLNFVIANGVVVVPVYGTPTQDAALEMLQSVFPDRSVIGVPSRGLLGAGDAGGGSFHCITQQEPA